MKSTDDKKGILTVVAILGLLLLSYFGYQSYSENQKNSELADFAKTYNETLKTEKANKDEKISETSTPEKANTETSTQKAENVKVVKEVETEIIEERTLTGKELEDYNNFVNPPRKIVPYTEPLPEMPDREVNNSTLLGIDTSKPGTPGYGVRDDVEIAIAKEFGDDSDAAKFMMASMAYQQKMLEMYQTGVDFEVYNYMSRKSGTLLSCATPDFRSSDEEYNNFWEKRKIVKKLQFNTPQRVIAEDKADGGLGSVDGGTTVSYQKCLEMLAQSVKDLQSPIYSLGKEG